MAGGMLSVALVVAITTAAGVMAEHRYNGRAERAARGLMQGVLWGAIPVVLFFNVATLDFSINIGAGIGFAYIGHGLTLLLAWAAGKFVFRLDRPQLGALMICAVMGNTAYLGFPFVASALGFDNLGEAVTYDTLVSLPLLVFVAFSIGAAYGTASTRPSDSVAAFFKRNPLLYAFIAAVLAPASLTPEWAVDASQVLVVCILPIGFFAVGVIMSHEADEARFRFPPPLTGPTAVAVGLRLTVTGAVILLLGKLIIDVPDAYAIEGAMSSGINCLLISHNYGLDRKLAASAIFWSTAAVLIIGIAVSVF